MRRTVTPRRRAAVLDVISESVFMSGIVGFKNVPVNCVNVRSSEYLFKGMRGEKIKSYEHAHLSGPGFDFLGA